MTTEVDFIGPPLDDAPPANWGAVRLGLILLIAGCLWMALTLTTFGLQPALDMLPITAKPRAFRVLLFEPAHRFFAIFLPAAMAIVGTVLVAQLPGAINLRVVVVLPAMMQMAALGAMVGASRLPVVAAAPAIEFQSALALAVLGSAAAFVASFLGIAKRAKRREPVHLAPAVALLMVLIAGVWLLPEPITANELLARVVGAMAAMLLLAVALFRVWQVVPAAPRSQKYRPMATAINSDLARRDEELAQIEVPESYENPLPAPGDMPIAKRMREWKRERWSEANRDDFNDPPGAESAS